MSVCMSCKSPLESVVREFPCGDKFHPRCLGENENQCPVHDCRVASFAEIKNPTWISQVRVINMMTDKFVRVSSASEKVSCLNTIRCLVDSLQEQLK